MARRWMCRSRPIARGAWWPPGNATARRAWDSRSIAPAASGSRTTRTAPRVPAYTIVGLLAERRVGRARLFINLENLTNVRLSRTHPLLLPSPTPLGQWTVDAWAPLEGRTINGGVRFGF